MTRRRRKLPFPMGKECPQYRRVWIIVDGAVSEAFRAHPEYLSDDAVLRVVRASIVKRVTGAITGWAVQTEQARSGERPAGETKPGAVELPANAAGKMPQALCSPENTKGDGAGIDEVPAP